MSSMRSQAGVVDINQKKNVVCGLSFSRSQPDFEGFPRALRFSPSSKLTPSLIHLAVVLYFEVIYGSCSGAERLTGRTAPSVRPPWAAPFAIQSTDCEKGWLAGLLFHSILASPSSWAFAENKLVSLLIIETLKAVSIGTYVYTCVVCITCFRCCPENPQRPRRLLNSHYQAYFCLRFSLTKPQCYATFLSCTTDSNYGTDR